MNASTEFVSTLMANNDKAREQVMELYKEVTRLKKRETELSNKIQQLIELRGEQKTEEDASFLEWLALFRLEADCPTTDKQDKSTADEKASDPRQLIYKPGEPEPKGQVEKFVRLKDELHLVSRLKKREVFPWLESRTFYTKEQIQQWESKNRMKLPPQLCDVYQYIGSNAVIRDQIDSVHIHAYSPFLSLLSLDDIGWTEVWGDDSEPDRVYYDDDRAESILDLFQAGHEFDDSFVCDQLCGKEREADECVRVLLIGAPLDVRMPGGGVVNSRMFLNIRPTSDGSKFVGDGLLYRLDCSYNARDEGDSELIKIGTPYQWLESCFVSEVDDRINKAGESDPIVKRYPWILEKRKRAKSADQQEDS